MRKRERFFVLSGSIIILFSIYCHIKRQPKADQTYLIIMNALSLLIEKCRYFESISGGVNERAYTPRGAELLFCFDVGPPPTTLAQHETNSGSSSCFYRAANTKRHPDLEPAVYLQRQLQRHLANSMARVVTTPIRHIHTRLHNDDTCQP